jgi:hypothetical protein
VDGVHCGGGGVVVGVVVVGVVVVGVVVVGVVVVGVVVGAVVLGVVVVRLGDFGFLGVDLAAVVLACLAGLVLAATDAAAPAPGDAVIATDPSSAAISNPVSPIVVRREQPRRRSGVGSGATK